MCDRPDPPQLSYQRIREILTAAQLGVARTVNTAQVLANWLIGREIVEAEQQGRDRAEYGENLLKNLADQLKADFGSGYSYTNLKLMRRFYLNFPTLIGNTEIGHAVRDQSLPSDSLLTLSRPNPDWQPGQLHPNLSWTHYRTLMRVDRPESRAFYEIEALKNNWSARENDAVVRYTLGPNQQNKIFASRYKLHLPTEAELQEEIRRELSQLQSSFEDRDS